MKFVSNIFYWFHTKTLNELTITLQTAACEKSSPHFSPGYLQLSDGSVSLVDELGLSPLVPGVHSHTLHTGIKYIKNDKKNCSAATVFIQGCLKAKYLTI